MIDDWDRKNDQSCGICRALSIIKKIFFVKCQYLHKDIFIGLVIIGYDFVVKLEFILNFWAVNIFKDMEVL